MLLYWLYWLYWGGATSCQAGPRLPLTLQRAGAFGHPQFSSSHETWGGRRVVKHALQPPTTWTCLLLKSIDPERFHPQPPAGVTGLEQHLLHLLQIWLQNRPRSWPPQRQRQGRAMACLAGPKGCRAAGLTSSTGRVPCDIAPSIFA